MALTLGNLAVKVPSLDEAQRQLTATPGCEVVTRHAIGQTEFLEADVGGVVTNVFESALYEEADSPLPFGPLHSSYFVDGLQEMLAEPAWSTSLIWGPERIDGGFGRRLIAFFEPLPGWRVELMEELDDGG